jgi:hypothetical protein
MLPLPSVLLDCAIFYIILTQLELFVAFSTVQILNMAAFK